MLSAQALIEGQLDEKSLSQLGMPVGVRLRVLNLLKGSAGREDDRVYAGTSIHADAATRALAPARRWQMTADGEWFCEDEPTRASASPKRTADPWELSDDEYQPSSGLHIASKYLGHSQGLVDSATVQTSIETGYASPLRSQTDGAVSAGTSPSAHSDNRSPTQDPWADEEEDGGEMAEEGVPGNKSGPAPSSDEQDDSTDVQLGQEDVEAGSETTAVRPWFRRAVADEAFMNGDGS